MTTIKVMNWNLERFGGGRAQIADLTSLIATILVEEEIDLFVGLEIAGVTGQLAMEMIAEGCRALAIADKQTNATGLYRCIQLAETTGGETYGFLVRDLSKLRPCAPAVGQGADDSLGCQQLPLRSMWDIAWTTFGGVADWTNKSNLDTTEILIPAPLAAPFVQVKRTESSNADWVNFQGQSMANGGTALGNGSRQPCVAMFAMQTSAGGTAYMAVVALHSGATRSASNILGANQFRQLTLLDVCQSYGVQAQTNPAVTGRAASQGYIDGNWVAPANLLVLGDFNMNFADTEKKKGKTYDAYQMVSPDTWNAPGTESGAPGNAGTAPKNAPSTVKTCPTVRFEPDAKFPMYLKTGIYNEMTHLTPVDEFDPNKENIFNGCLDNIFFGGTATYNQPAAIIPIPARIQDRTYIIAELAQYYAVLGVRHADVESLWEANMTINNLDALTGARLISDHLPVVLQLAV